MQKIYNQRIHSIFIILFVWILYLSSLAILQYFGLPFGFHVLPMEHDRLFLNLIASSHIQFIHDYWNIMKGNTLAAWEWYLFSFLIDLRHNTLYLIRSFLDLYLAIIVFLLFDQLGRKKSRIFAIYLSIVVLLWNFSASLDQILAINLIALSFNLLSIFFYCRYVDNNRQFSRDLPISLIFFFLAIASDPLQCGALFIIPFLAFFRSAKEVLNRVLSALLDGSFYLIIFVIYSCSWFIANQTEIFHFPLSVNFFIYQLYLTFQQLILFPSYLPLIKTVFNHQVLLTVLYILIISFLSNLIFYRWLRIKYDDTYQIPLVWIILFLISTILPSIFIISRHDLTHTVADSSMIEQVFQPLLYVSIIFLLGNFFKNIHLGRFFIMILISLLCAGSFAVGVIHNHHLVMKTISQKIK